MSNRVLIRQMTNLVRDWSCNGDQVALQVAKQLFTDLDTPTSLGLYIALEAGDIDSVVNHKIDPKSYDCPFRFRDDYLAVSYLKKYPFAGRKSLTREVARQKFLEAEDLCQATNRFFRRYRESPLLVDPTIHTIFHSMARKISSILGRFDYEAWASRCRFGPGATDVVRGPRATIYDKLGSQLSASADAAAAAVWVVNRHPAWLQARSGLGPFDDGCYRPIELSDLTLARGNAITFVPKDARTDRAIAIEPHLNIFLQLGVGALIRERLRKAGLDLDDATANQRLAYIGSKYGSVSTIDLSSASDTIAREVVREFIPQPWFDIMDLIRSKTGTIKDSDGNESLIHYQKFSSMGNGFTFELESLLFYAMALAVTETLGLDLSLVRVYGDDIVVPHGCEELLLKALGVLGFKTNREKSFFEGPFRESCGKDFYDGHDVRPIFLKEVPSDAKSLIRLANGLRRLAYRRNHYYGCDSRLRNAWVRAIRRLPDSLRHGLRGPLYREVDGTLVEVDGCIGSGLDEAQASRFTSLSHVERQRGWDGTYYHFARILETAKQFTPENIPVAYLSFLYGLSRGQTSREIIHSPSDQTHETIPIVSEASDEVSRPEKVLVSHHHRFRVPFRGLTTDKVTTRSLSRGWLDTVHWV